MKEHVKEFYNKVQELMELLTTLKHCKMNRADAKQTQNKQKKKSEKLDVRYREEHNVMTKIKKTKQKKLKHP